MQLIQTYKTLNDNVKVDLIPYVKDYMEQNPEVEILIGCDSQNRKRETIYAIVIGLYKPGKGAHVLYSRLTTTRIKIKENSTRLLNEVWYSVEVAERIKNELGIIATWIDVDINQDEQYKSNVALSNALGLVKGMGYNVRWKNSPGIEDRTPLMCYAADSLVK